MEDRRNAATTLIVTGPTVLFFGAFAFYLGLGSPLFPWLFHLIHAIESTCFVWGFVKRPKLAFVLPFEAYRLTVIDFQAGISLYTYTWKKGSEMADEDLFSGMIQGVSMIVKESVNKGDVQEIKMAEATLIYERSPVYPVACILVASKASKTLRDSLDAFSTKFFHQFGDKLEDSNNVTQFRPAEKLVEECFSFLETSQKK